MDKLFRDQLGNHEVPLSSQAWDRLEAARAGKKKASSWWMIAASLVILISAGTYFIQQADQKIEPQVLAEEGATRSETSKTDLLERAAPMEAPVAQISPELHKETMAGARESSQPALSSTSGRASQQPVEEQLVKREIAAIQTQFSKSSTLQFDPETIVVPEHLMAPKKVIESAGLRVEIYQNLTAPDSVKKAVVQQKNLLKRVVNAALDVKNGEKELSDVLDLDKLIPPLERKNN
jgi:hypothetical protein